MVGIGTPWILIAFSLHVSRKWFTALPNASAGGPPSSVSSPHSQRGSSSKHNSLILDFGSSTALATKKSYLLIIYSSQASIGK